MEAESWKLTNETKAKKNFFKLLASPVSRGEVNLIKYGGHAIKLFILLSDS